MAESLSARDCCKSSSTGETLPMAGRRFSASRLSPTVVATVLARVPDRWSDTELLLTGNIRGYGGTVSMQ
ncbi:hypothetical protein Slala02_60530 [Streptomyces lavendulae subsp. lavendulae]|nr:hypothetical protein Slala01_65970 [Streptomyces lavendulae subsp. lavendulae]GLX30233.1 hypothetical protein Slala02_60530 [Streptomyces lavendulae subsp. lavendulae]